MNIRDYDFPTSDYESYTRYPQLNWMYNVPALLNSQNIEWSPFASDRFCKGLRPFTVNINALVFCDIEPVYTKSNIPVPGWVCVAPAHGNRVQTECFFQKGEVKYMTHFDEFKLIDNINGAVDLRISAFATLYLRKFTGAISFETFGDQIYSVKLRPTMELLDLHPESAAKIFCKLYKKL